MVLPVKSGIRYVPTSYKIGKILEKLKIVFIWKLYNNNKIYLFVSQQVIDLGLSAPILLVNGELFD